MTGPVRIVRTALSEMEQIMLDKLAEGGTVTFSPKGYSMIPMLRSRGDNVTLEKPPARMKRGMVALFLSDDGDKKKFILHRLVSIKDGKYTFCGDNRMTNDVPVPYENILGVVVGYTHGGKKRTIDGFGYRLYSFIMVSTYRIRPVTLRAERLLIRIWRRIRGI